MLDHSKLNDWERNFLAEIQVRALSNQPVSTQERQIVWNLAIKAGVVFTPQQVTAVQAQGIDTASTRCYN